VLPALSLTHTHPVHLSSQNRATGPCPASDSNQPGCQRGTTPGDPFSYSALGLDIFPKQMSSRVLAMPPCPRSQNLPRATPLPDTSPLHRKDSAFESVMFGRRTSGAPSLHLREPSGSATLFLCPVHSEAGESHSFLLEIQNRSQHIPGSGLGPGCTVTRTVQALGFVTDGPQKADNRK
jgi:hypothetical protein